MLLSLVLSCTHVDLYIRPFYICFCSITFPFKQINWYLYTRSGTVKEILSLISKFSCFFCSEVMPLFILTQRWPLGHQCSMDTFFHFYKKKWHNWTLKIFDGFNSTVTTSNNYIVSNIWICTTSWQDCYWRLISLQF